MLRQFISTIFGITLLSGCASVNDALYSSISYGAMLYPANNGNSEDAAINATFNASSDPNKAPISFSLADGEKMHGVLLLLKSKPKDFGSIYSSLDSKVDKKGKEVTSKNGSPGVADIIGSNGSKMNCEFFHRPGPHGAGVCKSSDGQLYKFVY